MGRPTIVTGAASPLGQALCSSIVKDGRRCIAIVRNGSDPSNLSHLDAKLLERWEYDLRNPLSVSSVSERIERLDHVPWAFVHLASTIDKDNFQIKAMQDVFAVNVFSAWSILDSCLAAMGGAGGGRVVFVGSVGHKFGGKPDSVAYSASKYLMEYFPNKFRECGRNNVLVNTIRLGVMAGGTQGKTLKSPEEFADRVSLIPTRKYVGHEDVVRLIEFLSSKGNGSIHNSIIPCTGGE